MLLDTGTDFVGYWNRGIRERELRKNPRITKVKYSVEEGGLEDHGPTDFYIFRLQFSSPKFSPDGPTFKV